MKVFFPLKRNLSFIRERFVTYTGTALLKSMIISGKSIWATSDQCWAPGKKVGLCVVGSGGLLEIAKQGTGVVRAGGRCADG